MNDWTQKSIQIANSPAYLDKLQKIYDVSDNAPRIVSRELVANAKRYYDAKNKLELIKTLIKFEKFPIDDSYIAFFRRYPNSLNENPETIERIGNRLLSMGFEDMVERLEEPKVANRQIGIKFHAWLKKNFTFCDTEAFLRYSGDQFVFLNGSDANLKDFANSNLGCNLTKGIDLCAKINNQYVIGESKFICDQGGHQTTQLKDAIHLMDTNAGRAIRIAVLDGTVWIKGENQFYKMVSNLGDEKIALSALLLEKFLMSVR